MVAFRRRTVIARPRTVAVRTRSEEFAEEPCPGGYVSTPTDEPCGVTKASGIFPDMSNTAARLNAALEGRYAIERELGEGSMATVFLADDLKHERKVALKVLKPELAAVLGSERFLAEIKTTASLQHPHILPLFDSGEADGYLFYVMPYVEGESLRDHLTREGELSIEEVVRILRDVVGGLTHAHEHGVVHRDIKPENIMLSGRHALVTDFGVAKAVSRAKVDRPHTTEGVAIGTPFYMAPEQAQASENIDHRVDIYSVGVLAYELLTGAHPFATMVPQMILVAQVSLSPEPVTTRRSEVSPALGQLVMRCLEKNPSDRWQSAEELLESLEAVDTPDDTQRSAATSLLAAIREQSLLNQVLLLGAFVVTLAALTAVLLRPGPLTITTSGSRRLTRAPGLEFLPELSPDGSEVLYSAGPINDLNVYVQGLSGGNAHELGGDLSRLVEPHWSLDGEDVRFWTCLIEECTLREVARLGGAPRAIQSVGGKSLSTSPDGTRIAYVLGFPAGNDLIGVPEVDLLGG